MGNEIEPTDLPYFLYLYDAKGRYRAPQKISTDAELRLAFAGPIKKHVAEKLEVVVTDSGDDCVFHAKEGKILFPTPADYAKHGG